jgi:hypothetical protein
MFSKFAYKFVNTRIRQSAPGFTRNGIPEPDKLCHADWLLIKWGEVPGIQE